MDGLGGLRNGSDQRGIAPDRLYEFATASLLAVEPAITLDPRDATMSNRPAGEWLRRLDDGDDGRKTTRRRADAFTR